MTLDTIPVDAKNTFSEFVALLQNREALANGFRIATAWVRAAIKAVRDAPGGDAMGDDEAIAGAILRRIDEKCRPAV